MTVRKESDDDRTAMCRRVVDGRGEALPKTTVLPPPFVVYVRRRALVAAASSLTKKLVVEHVLYTITIYVLVAVACWPFSPNNMTTMDTLSSVRFLRACANSMSAA